MSRTEVSRPMNGTLGQPMHASAAGSGARSAVVTSLSLSQRFRKSILRKMLRTWLIQGIGWYALTEVGARLILEIGFCVILLLLGLGLEMILVGWILFHTAAWLLLYGGFMRIWILRVRSTKVPRLSSELDRVARKVVSQPFFRVVFLRGSGGRGELRETSDIDLCAVPEKGFRAKAAGILFWWAIRAESVFRRFPLEARWIDAERYIPYHVVGETPRVVKSPPAPDSLSQRLASRGLLVAFSGLSPVETRSAADHLGSVLRLCGFDTFPFDSRRAGLPWRRNGHLSLASGFQSVLKHVGRSEVDWHRHARVKTVYDLLSLFDQATVAWRFATIRRPGWIALSEGSVADTIASLRARGPLRTTIEGLLLGCSFEPDVAVLIDVAPPSLPALGSDVETPWVERLTHEYRDLKALLRLAAVDATRPALQVRLDIERIVEERLGGPWGEASKRNDRSRATGSLGA